MGVTGLLPGKNLADLIDQAVARTNLQLGTGDSPTFAGLTLNGPANLNADILFGTNNAFDVGTTSSRARNGWFGGTVVANDVSVVTNGSFGGNVQVGNGPRFKHDGFGTMQVRNSADSAYATLSCLDVGPTNAVNLGANGDIALKRQAAGVVRVDNYAGTAGVSLDISTDGTLKVRNRGNSADANLTASNLTASGTGTFGGVITTTVGIGATAISLPYERVINLGDACILRSPGWGALILRNQTSSLALYIEGVNGADCIGGTSGISWKGLGGFGPTANGKWQWSNAAVSAGAILDFSTDATLKIRNRADSADAALTCSNLTASGLTHNVGGTLNLTGEGLSTYQNRMTWSGGYIRNDGAVALSSLACEAGNQWSINYYQWMLGNQIPLGWSSIGGIAGTLNVAFARNADGVIEINNGTRIASGGAYRDLNLRNLTASGTGTFGGVTVNHGASGTAKIVSAYSGYTGFTSGGGLELNDYFGNNTYGIAVNNSGTFVIQNKANSGSQPPFYISTLGDAGARTFSATGSVFQPGFLVDTLSGVYKYGTQAVAIGCNQTEVQRWAAGSTTITGNLTASGSLYVGSTANEIFSQYGYLNLKNTGGNGVMIQDGTGASRIQVSGTTINLNGNTYTGHLKVIGNAGNTYDIGENSYRYRDGYFAGTLYSGSFSGASLSVTTGVSSTGYIIAYGNSVGLNYNGASIRLPGSQAIVWGSSLDSAWRTRLYESAGGTLTVDNGSGGAATLAVIGDLTVSESLTFTEVNNGNSGTSKTIAWGNGNHQFLTLTGNVTLAFTDPPASGRFTLVITQDGTGGHTVTWPASVKWPGGAAPTISAGASAVDIVTLVFRGTTYYASISQNFS